MSNEPTSQRLLAPAPDGPAAEPMSETDRMAAAVQRMETAVRTERHSIEQIRAEFAEMMQSVAQIRAAVTAIGQRHVEVDGLLEQLEVHAQSMAARLAPLQAAAEPETAAEPVTEPRTSEEQAFLDALGAGPIGVVQAEAGQVPTVSGVVSQLGRADPAEAAEPADARGMTTVAMLEAMVEELTAAMPLRPPPEAQSEIAKAETETAEAAYTAAEVTAPEAETTLHATPVSENAEAAAFEFATFDVEFVDHEPAPVASLPEDMLPSPVQEGKTATHEFVATEFGVAEATITEPTTPANETAETATLEAPAFDVEFVDDDPAPVASLSEDILPAPAAEFALPQVVATFSVPQAEATEPPTSENERAEPLTSAGETEETAASESATFDIEAIQSGRVAVSSSSEDISTGEIPPPEMQAAPAPEFAPPPGPIMPDVDLMSNFARMEAVPYLRSEIGTAVIFKRAKPVAEDPTPDVMCAEPARTEAPAAALPVAEALASEAPTKNGETLPSAPLDNKPTAFEEPGLVFPPPDPDEATLSAVAPGDAAPAQQAILPIEAPAQPIEPDLDLLLFGLPQDTDPDPAAFLLDPAPRPERASATSPDEARAPQLRALAAHGNTAGRLSAVEQASPATQAAPRHDPLAALKAMSEEEKIALFE